MTGKGEVPYQPSLSGSITLMRCNLTNSERAQSSGQPATLFGSCRMGVGGFAGPFCWTLDTSDVAGQAI